MLRRLFAARFLAAFAVFAIVVAFYASCILFVLLRVSHPECQCVLARAAHLHNGHVCTQGAVRNCHLRIDTRPQVRLAESHWQQVMFETSMCRCGHRRVGLCFARLT